MKTIAVALLLSLGMMVGCGGDGAKPGSVKAGSVKVGSAAPASSAAPAGTAAKK